MLIPHTTLRRYLFSVLSGVLLWVSYPFTGSLTPLIFLAWAPLFLVAISLQNDGKNLVHFFLHAYLSMLIFNTGTTWWIANSTTGGAMMAFICNSLLMALALALGYGLFKRAKKHIFLMGIATLYLCFEFAHLNWELSWPWLTMGNYFSIRPSWIQFYEFTGVLGGSLWVMSSNVLLTCIAMGKQIMVRKSMFFVCILVIPVLTSVLIGSLHSPKSDQEKVSILLLQPNINPYTEKFVLSPYEQLNTMLTQCKPHLSSKPQLIIGPETALLESFVESDFRKTQSFKILRDSLIKKGHKILIGASTFRIFKTKHSAASKAMEQSGFYESYNSSLYFSSNKMGFVHKSKLVLGVEKIPFSSLFPILEEWSIDNGGTSGSLGVESTPKVFRDGSLTIAPIVCYESIYGDFVSQQCRKGANLLCIITNDGWWGNTPGHKQHQSFANLRAIESRKMVVRSGNTGISSITNTLGETLSQTNYETKTTVQADVPLNSSLTFYARFGDYLGWVFIFILFVTLGFATLPVKKEIL